MLVDSGALYSVVPTPILRRLGISPDRTETFRLADGTALTRDVGGASFEIAGRHALSPVIFGKRGDHVLLGVVTLEALGLALDPIRRRLRPIELRLGQSRRKVRARRVRNPVAHAAAGARAGAEAGSALMGRLADPPLDGAASSPSSRWCSPPGTCRPPGPSVVTVGLRRWP